MSITEFGKRFRKHRAVILICLVLLAPGTLRAEQLPIRTYTTADGLARDQINRIVLDSRGFLWFCTVEGLSRFDGYRFTNYTTDQGLPPRSVNDLLETRNGDYWIATSDGVVRFNPTFFSEAGSNSVNQSSSTTKSDAPKANAMFVIYRPGDEETARHVNVLLEDHTGTIWCGTKRGVYRLEQIDNRVSFRFVDVGMPSKTYGDTVVNAVLEDRHGAVWAGTQGSGLYRHLPDGRTERYTTRQGLPTNIITSLLEDREGHLWVGTTQGLCELVPEPNLTQPIVARVYTTKDGLPGSNHIQSLFQSADGRLWVGGYGGLSEFIFQDNQANQTFRSYTNAEGLNGLEFGALAEDRDGNIWMAGDGVMKLARTGFTSFGEADGIGDPVIASIFENQAGELCVISSALTDKFIHQFDGHKFTTIRPNVPRSVTYFGWGWNQITFQDHTGEWWVVTGHGLYRFAKVNRVEQLAHARPKAVYTSKDGLVVDDIFRLYEDLRGDIWVVSVSATQHRLTRWERATETFHNYSEADGLPSMLSALITAFCEDAAGNLWVATNGFGLARYAAGRFTLFTTSDGVPAGWIRALHLDRSGRLWVASSQGGLSEIEDPKAAHPRFVSHTTVEGLLSNDVLCITEDQWGRIYAGTGRGVDRLDLASGHVKHYTTADGLAKGELQVAFRDRQGALWFGTSQGLSRLVPTPDQPESSPPILISGLRIAGVRYPMSELGTTAVAKLELGPNENQVQIDFIGLGFGSSGTLHYQYLLEGADRDWSALTDERTVNYASLRPGNYRFLVRAVTAGGVASVSPATVAFTILPPLWQRWWVITLLALTIGLAVYSLYRYRVARLLELERVRTRIATDLHDDIGSSLSQVSMLSEVIRRRLGHDPNVSEPLSVIASLSRDLVDSMSDIVWAINPKRDRLSDLTQRMRRFASDVFTARQIEFTFQAPDARHDLRLSADTRREVFMIFKESVNNTIRHSGCTEATINFLVEDGALELKLHDNGRGFDPQQANEGNGLASMRQRAMKLGGRFTLTSGNDNGTTVTLRAPVARRGRFWRRFSWQRR